MPSLATTTIRPETRLDRIVHMIDPVLDIENRHTGEKILVRYHGVTGYRMDAIRRINWIMRDWRQESLSQVDPRLLWALSAIRMAAMRDGNPGKILLLSGYRTAETNAYLRSRGVRAAYNSLHLQARAADIVIPGTDLAHVSDYARWLQVGGVGTYRRSGFTHIDSGRERSWGG